MSNQLEAMVNTSSVVRDFGYKCINIWDEAIEVKDVELVSQKIATSDTDESGDSILEKLILSNAGEEVKAALEAEMAATDDSPAPVSSVIDASIGVIYELGKFMGRENRCSSLSSYSEGLDHGYENALAQFEGDIGEILEGPSYQDGIEDATDDKAFIMGIAAGAIGTIVFVIAGYTFYKYLKKRRS